MFTKLLHKSPKNKPRTLWNCTVFHNQVILISAKETSKTLFSIQSVKREGEGGEALKNGIFFHPTSTIPPLPLNTYPQKRQKKKKKKRDPAWHCNLINRDASYQSN